MTRPNIINHIIEDLDDQTADILNSYLKSIEEDNELFEKIAKQDGEMIEYLHGKVESLQEAVDEYQRGV